MGSEIFLFWGLDMFSGNQNDLPVVLSEYFAGETGRPNQVDRIEEIGA
jgi:hypothetical protein